ncbi:hypothetical protein BJ170DRAFT_310914 [Xylariales sp. AK1849]|nr:hypothetical protein BJ170DRAFT_310914 [Xylariales sp. AK1849]
MKFRNNIFDVPDYDLLDKCDSTVSIPPPKDGRKQYADTHRTSSDYPLSATFRSQLSDERKSTQTGKTRDLPISLSPILAQDQPDELVQSPKSMSPSGLGQQMRGRTASDSGLASAVATRTNVVSPPERQPTQQVEDSQKSDYIRHNSQPVKAVPSGCQSTSELEPPAPDQPTTRQRNLSFTEKEVALNRTRKGGASREVGYRGRRPSSPNANPIGSRFIGNQGTASREQSIGSWSYQEQTDASPAPQLRWSPEFVGEPRMEQPGLQVTAKETVIAGAGDVEAEDGEEELLNENVSVDATPKHFDSDIVAVGPLVPGSQSLPMACKVRIFKHKLNEGIRVRTDRDGKIRGDRLEKHVELVPSYAFADDEAAEGAAIYFRSKGTQVGLKYKFLKTPNGTSALYGFQGAMLGMTFGDEYQVLEAVLKNAKGSEVLKYPRLQFWSDRSQEAAAQSSSEGTKSSHRSSIISKTISPKEASLGSIEKVKKTLNCTRLFIFTKIPRPAIYVLIVDETTTIGVPPSPKLSFRPRSPQKHSLCIAPDKAKGDDKIRLHQIRDGAGIPLDLNGLLYKDLYGSGFVEYKTLQLDFYSKEGCESFRQDFNEFRDDWDAHLESPRKEMDVQRDPRIRIKSSVENNRSFKVLGFDTIG